MNAPSKSPLPLVLSLLFLPILAQAHPGLHVHGFTSGLTHPLLGLDHLCAMIAVGLWGAQRGGKAIWALPATFLGFMLVGAVLAKSGVILPRVELGIAVSVLVLGLLITAAVRLPVEISAAIVGVFALFHGHAHAMEAPMDVSGVIYGAGFLFSTALLHLAGVGLGIAIQRLGKAEWVRFAGGAVALCGAVLLAS